MNDLNRPGGGGRHVVLAIDSMNGGGAERVCLGLVAHLLQGFHVVDLLLCQFRGPLLAEIPAGANLFAFGSGYGDWPCSVADDQIVQLGTPPPRDSAASWPVILRHIVPLWPYWPRKIPRKGYVRVRRSFAFAEYFLLRKPDVGLSFSSEAYYHLLAGMRISGVSVPVVASIRNSIAKSSGFNRHRIYKKLLGHSRRVHANSVSLKDEVSSLGVVEDGRIVTIYNPSCREEIGELAKASPEHAWLSAKGDSADRVVLAVGRLARQKNHGLLIDAFADIASDERLKLVILGEGGERKQLERHVRSLGLCGRVDLAGWKRNPYAYMSRCEVFVLCSDYEGLPNVLIEALACGCAIVSTDCRHGPGEILEGGRWGRLVPVGDRQALASAIAQSLGVKPDGDSLRRRASDFRPEKMLPQYERLMAGAMAEPEFTAGGC